MINLLYLLQIVTGILLVILIILQPKGSGLGSTFGGNMAFYSSRRGAEKLVFIATIIVAAIFLLSSLASVIVN